MLSSLRLLSFRNHEEFSVQCNHKYIVISGCNGVGKTNILEAISLFAPGKGFRGSKLDSMLKVDSYLSEWGITAEYSKEKLDNNVEINIGYSLNRGRKEVIIDGSISKKYTEILDIARIIWLTPQMSGLFLDSSPVRRKFLDRMVYNFIPNHAQKILQYEYGLKNRLKLLTENIDDEILLNRLEMYLAELSIEISENRITIINQLNVFLNQKDYPFIKPIIDIKGFMDGLWKQTSSSDEYELYSETIKREFKKSRNLDAKSYSNFGPHKIDLDTSHPSKSISASNSSTGEQKSMLISMILGQTNMIYEKYNIIPILLLDEVFTHLDAKNEELLIDTLKVLNAQIWISTIDNKLYKKLAYDSTKHVAI